MTEYYRFQPLPFDDVAKSNEKILRDYYNDIREKNYIILGYNWMFKNNLNNYSDKDIGEICRNHSKTSRVATMILNFRKIVAGDIIYVYFQKSYPFPEEVKEKSLIGIVTNKNKEGKCYEFNTSYGIYSNSGKKTGHNHILHVRWLPKLYNLEQGGSMHYSLSTIHDKEFIQKLNDIINSDKDSNTILSNTSKYSMKNIIFYGPPGTGKTFKTKEKAIKIIT